VNWIEYIDESYNSRTLCVGGLLAPASMWKTIETKWRERIDHENRLSVKKGFAPISRYHATDCANLKREFSEANGWSIPRQIRFSKRLCQILVGNGPCAIVYGGGTEDVRKHLAPEQDIPKEYLYYISVYEHLIMAGETMNDRFPDAMVSVYYDRTKQFGKLAQQAFEAFMKDTSAKQISKYFATMAPKGWEDCIALQPADFMAYEGMKRIDSSLHGGDDVRKSLRALLGDNMPLKIEHFTEENFRDLITISNNKEAGRPLDEGVESKMKLCHREGFVPASEITS
jgi:hypothetical protein